MGGEARAKNARASPPTRQGKSYNTVTHVPGLICYLSPRPHIENVVCGSRLRGVSDHRFDLFDVGFSDGAGAVGCDAFGEAQAAAAGASLTVRRFERFTLSGRCEVGEVDDLDGAFVVGDAAEFRHGIDDEREDGQRADPFQRCEIERCGFLTPLYLPDVGLP